jgi:hypothetical protein
LSANKNKEQAGEEAPPSSTQVPKPTSGPGNASSLGAAAPGAQELSDSSSAEGVDTTTGKRSQRSPASGASSPGADPLGKRVRQSEAEPDNDSLAGMSDEEEEKFPGSLAQEDEKQAEAQYDIRADPKIHIFANHNEDVDYSKERPFQGVPENIQKVQAELTEKFSQAFLVDATEIQMSDDSRLELPKDWKSSLGKFSGFFESMAKGYGLTITPSNEISLGKNTAAAFFKEPSQENAISLKDLQRGQTQQAAMLWRDAIKFCLSPQKFSNRVVESNLGSATISRYFAIATQTIYYGLEPRDFEVCLKCSMKAAQVFKEKMTALWPQGQNGIDLLLAALRKLTQNFVKSLAEERNEEKMAEWTQICSTYFSSNSSLCEKLYNRTSARRLNAQAKGKASRNPRYKPKDSEYETYTKVSRPYISTAKMYLTVKEQAEVRSLNSQLQKASSRLAGLKLSFNQKARKSIILEYIASLHGSCKDAQRELGRRKSAAHSILVAEQSEAEKAKDPLDRAKFSTESWRSALEAVAKKDKFLNIISASFGPEGGYGSNKYSFSRILKNLDWN